MPFLKNWRIRLANSEKRNHFDFERDCIESIDQSKIVSLLISIGILLVFKIVTACLYLGPFQFFLAMFFTFQYAISLACPWLNIFLYILFLSFHRLFEFSICCSMLSVNRKKSEFFPTWMLFVLSCFSYVIAPARTSSTAQRNSGNSRHLSLHSKRKRLDLCH